MKAYFAVHDSNSIVFEMRLRMTLGEWAQLRDCLEASGTPPFTSVAGRLRTEIIKMVNMAREYWIEEARGEDMGSDCEGPE